MSVLFVVLPLAILIVAGAVGAYVWSARSGQFDDLDTPAMRILHDDDAATPNPATTGPARPSGGTTPSPRSGDGGAQ